MSEQLTPMMQQYQSIRRSLPADTLLLFRLGDFFEMFFEDAKEAAAILNVALTKRNNVPMCGIPERAHEGYVRRLIKAGKISKQDGMKFSPNPQQLEMNLKGIFIKS